MQQTLTVIGMLAGGLGLFMMAVAMITDGLKLAAGNALKDLLGKWTRSPGHGIATGIFITAIVQSSSAVTVATIGFVNAGLLSMFQALGVIYGANIGTTMTGWLVAMVGFKIKVEAFALPLIGVGMLLRLTGGESRRAYLGLALAGFGLFFIGIDVLKEAFEGLATAVDLQRFKAEGVTGILLFALLGFLMTVLTQSSSAAIAIILTATVGGIVGLYAAGAMVIGANVGTTSTAAVSVIGATPNAKRVAAAHVIFNGVTGIVALLIMPVLFWLVNKSSQVMGLSEAPVVTLALFHTLFNILGVLIMWPVTGRLAQWLEKRFVSFEETEARPKFLDKTVAVSPALAINALTLELGRLATMVKHLALAAISTEAKPGKRLATDRQVVEKLAHSVSEFISRLERSSLTTETHEKLKTVLSVEQHLWVCSNESFETAKHQAGLMEIDDEELAGKIARYHAAVVELFRAAVIDDEAFDLAEYKSHLTGIEEQYDALKAALLTAGAQLNTPIPGMIEILEQNNRIRRMARQYYKAMRQLAELYASSSIKPSLASQNQSSGPQNDDKPETINEPV